MTTRSFLTSTILFPQDDQLKDWLKNQTDASRIGTKQIELLRYFIDFCVSQGTTIDHRDHVDDYPFIHFDEMKRICRNYTPIRDACLIQHGGYSQAEKRCKHIIDFTDAFTSLVGKGLMDAMSRHKSSPTAESTALFHPGNDNANYTFSQNTHRRFCPAGRLPKEVLKQLYVGAKDFDMQNCYPNLFLNWAEDEGFEIPDCFTILRNDRDAFYQQLLQYDDLVKMLHPDHRKLPKAQVAKLLVQKLFHPPKSRKRRMTGVEFYDLMGQWIDGVLSVCGVKRDQVHLLLSELEANCIGHAVDVVGEHRFAVDKHDGFIAVDIQDDEVDFLLDELERLTDIKWVCESFVNSATDA